MSTPGKLCFIVIEPLVWTSTCLIYSFIHSFIHLFAHKSIQNTQMQQDK